MTTRTTLALAALACAQLLAACGGGGDSSGDGNAASGGGTTTGGSTTTPTTTTGFTKSATWTFTPPAKDQSLCFDFDAGTQGADCSGTAWDVKATGTGSALTLWTNSGSSGTGKGGAFGSPFDHTWTDLQAWTNATTDPVNGAIPSQLYFADAASGAFTGSNDIRSAAFEYGLGGETDHLLYPNYRVFLVTSNSASADNVGTSSAPVFAVQITGYYGGASGTTSGHPSLRWVDRANPSAVRTASIDASAGWVYFDLISGTVSSQTGTWQIAFNRYNVELNGGTSGIGKVAGFVARTPDGLYDGSGKAVAASIMAATPATTLAYLTAADLAVPASASAWVKDGLSSSLNPAMQGTYPNPLDYGWYTYYPTASAAAAAGLGSIAHLIAANPQRGTLVRSGEGSSYARMHLSSIAYANATDATSTQTWTFSFDVQPAP